MKVKKDNEDTSEFRWVILIITLLAFVTYAYGYQIVPPLIPPIIKEFNISNAQAGLLMSVVLIPGIILSWTALILVPLYGAASDRLSKRKLFIVAGLALTSLTFVAVSLVSDQLLLATIILLGVFSAMIPSLVQTLPSEILDPSIVIVGFGVMTLVGNFGSVLAPPLIGYVLDVTNSFFYTVVSLSVITLSGLIIGITLKTK